MGMTLLRHQVLDSSGQPVSGHRAELAPYPGSVDGRPGVFQRSRAVHAISGDDGWLTWALPSGNGDRNSYVITGIESNPVLVSVPKGVSTATVTETRIGSLTPSGPVPNPGQDLVTTGMLASRLAGMTAGLSAALSAVPGNDLIREAYIPARLSPGALSALPLRTEVVLRDALTIDVRDHSVTGDGVTDDTAALQAVLDALPEGGEALLRPGTYLVSAPLLLRRNRGIRGTHAGLWPYDTGGPVRIKAATTFTGDALVRLRDEEDLYGSVGAAASGLYVGPNDQSGMWLTRLTLDGFNTAGGIDGIKASGLVRSVRLTEVTVRRCTGSGFHTVSYTRTGGTVVYPRGWRLVGCVADSCGSNGFALNLTNDTTLVDCLAVNSASHGFYLAGPGELLLIGCRAPFNKARGFYLTGTCYGNVVLSACSTDRNEQSGIYVDCTRQPILLSGCTLRRDGRNGNGGGGSYAGLLVSGATAPVIVSGLTTETGQDDDGTGTMSPQYGLRVLNSTAVVVDSGTLWGFTAAVSDGGGNSLLRIGPSVVRATGSPNSPSYTYGGELGVSNANPVPTTNPVGGGVLYAEGGALKWRGPSGTITTIAPA